MDILERALLYLLLAASEFVFALVLIPIVVSKRGIPVAREQVVLAALFVAILMSTLQVVLIEVGVMR